MKRDFESVPWTRKWLGGLVTDGLITEPPTPLTPAEAAGKGEIPLRHENRSTIQTAGESGGRTESILVLDIYFVHARKAYYTKVLVKRPGPGRVTSNRWYKVHSSILYPSYLPRFIMSIVLYIVSGGVLMQSTRLPLRGTNATTEATCKGLSKPMPVFIE
jgi:hypothetical protein